VLRLDTCTHNTPARTHARTHHTPARQNAIEASLAYDKCLAQKGDARLSCQLDKALTNVGALLAARVEGRVCTEIDPRLSNDTGEAWSGARGARVGRTRA
jgi:transaldolase